MAAFEAPRAISQAEEVSTRNVQDHLRAESKIKRVLGLFIYEKRREKIRTWDKNSTREATQRVALRSHVLIFRGELDRISGAHKKK